VNDSARLPVYEFEGFRLDAQRRVLLGKDGGAIQLTPRLVDYCVASEASDIAADTRARRDDSLLVLLLINLTAPLGAACLWQFDLVEPLHEPQSRASRYRNRV
jgi:hypothetical protein